MSGDVDVPVVIRRQIYTQKAFDGNYRREPKRGKATVSCLVRNWCKRWSLCSQGKCFTILKSFMPILTWLPRYNKADILPDVIAGLTCGIMHIPQGMGYAQLAALDPVYGLYTSFFPALFYILFGTSRHVSIGTFAVGSLMVGQARYKLCPHDTGNLAPENDPMNDTFELYSPLNASNEVPFLCHDSTLTPAVVATTLTFLVGLIQLTLGLFRLGFLSVLLSDQVVSGFTTAAAIMVFTSQVGKIFGMPTPRHQDFGKLYFIYRDIIMGLPDTNLPTLVLATICIIILFVNKKLFSPIFKRKARIDFPMDLLLLIVTTLLSYVFQFKNKFGIKVVGHIPRGIPSPEIPRLELVPDLIGDAISLSVVAFAITVSMAQIFAKRHKYAIYANQELTAVGLVNTGASFFGAFVAGASLSRTSVNASAGCRNQLSAIFSCGILLLVLLFIGPLFENLPQCVLSAIIVVALEGLLFQIKELRYLWPRSKTDFLIWLVAFLATCACDVTFGLLISCIFALATTIGRNFCVNNARLAQVSSFEMCRDTEKYTALDDIHDIKIFGYDGPVFYANAASFRLNLYKLCKIDMIYILTELERVKQANQKRKDDAKLKEGFFCEKLQVFTRRAEKLRRHRTEKNIPGIYSHSRMHALVSYEQQKAADDAEKAVLLATEENLVHVLNSFHLPKFVIIEASGISYIDVMGMDIFCEIHTELSSLEITLLFAGFKEGVLKFLDNAKEFYNKVPSSCIFLSVFDAVEYAKRICEDSKFQDHDDAVWYWPD